MPTIAEAKRNCMEAVGVMDEHDLNDDGKEEVLEAE